MAQSDAFDSQEPAIEAIRAGDRYAFGDLVRRNNGWVRGVIFGVLGEQDRVDDVAQQVWTAVWQRIGELRAAERWRPWVYRLARNAAIDAGRSRQRDAGWLRRVQQSGRSAAGSFGTASTQTPDQNLTAREQQQEVLAAIQALPAHYREPFVLRHLNGWTYGRIAEVMGMPVDSVETRLVRARRFLRDQLKDRVF